MTDLAHDAFRERQLGVRAGADAEIIAEPPVIEVVPGFAAGFCERRGFVVPISGVGQRGFDRVGDVGRLILVGQPRRVTVEERIWLDGQMVKRKMRSRKSERLGDVGTGFFHRLPG